MTQIGSKNFRPSQNHTSNFVGSKKSCENQKYSQAIAQENEDFSFENSFEIERK